MNDIENRRMTVICQDNSKQIPKTYCIITFYKLCKLAGVQNIQEQLIAVCRNNGIKGTILLAIEGINSTIVGTHDAIMQTWEKIISIREFADMSHKISYAECMPFTKLKVKIKKSVLTFDLPQRFSGSWNKNEARDNPVRGQYLEPDAWDSMITSPNTILIDTRNHYEVVMGSFKNAINPRISNFSELARWVEENLRDADRSQPIAMYCTGGIRCEKSTSLMHIMGFKNVYHLRDGILNYLEHRKKTQTDGAWEGQLFVFDNRVSLNKDLEPTEDPT